MSSSIPDPIPYDATPEQLRHYVNYWRLEAQGYAVRWNLAMQYGDNLKAENERLRKAGDAMENELFRVILMELPGLEKEDINNQYIADWRAAKGVQP